MVSPHLDSPVPPSPPLLPFLSLLPPLPPPYDATTTCTSHHFQQLVTKGEEGRKVPVFFIYKWTSEKSYHFAYREKKLSEHVVNAIEGKEKIIISIPINNRSRVYRVKKS